MYDIVVHQGGFYHVYTTRNDLVNKIYSTES